MKPLTRYQARPLHETSRPQPVSVWAERLDMALFVIGLLAILLVVSLASPS